MAAPPPPYTPPSSILIIGSGVFGLSTALSLAQRPLFAGTRITVLDRSPEAGVFPASDASSVDSSRIVRADYADPAYASLAARAIAQHWRRPDGLGGGGRYAESGLLIAGGGDGEGNGLAYVRRSYDNARALGAPVRALPSPADVRAASGTGAAFGGGGWGYLNAGSGWADAAACMRWMHARAVETGRIAFVNGTAERLLVSSNDDGQRRVVTGVRLLAKEAKNENENENETLSADLVVVAAGAWTPALVDLSGQAVATGQVIGYVRITEEEQARLGANPVLLDLTDGLFVIPPRDCVLKVARHSYGYLNPTTVAHPPLGNPDPQGLLLPPPPSKTVSLPLTHLDDANLEIPEEGKAALREGLRKLVPELEDRPFFKTRLCWYTDTPTADWIIDYHPHWQGLFIATGGSGHAFKFLPVLGDQIVDSITGNPPKEFREKWKWRTVDDVEKVIATEDGSRGGSPGLILSEEWKRGK
ncbi:FAD dependent oxidoreductase [Biscogniauxia mediterranea]|nr:FAD dependent oxidoreductase [Biscogniauxia mediterranea]